MNLGFKNQFVPYVEDGSKRHSIRGGQRWKVGMRADLFARPRQKGMRLLFRAWVVKVEDIVIREALTGRLLDDGTMTQALSRTVVEIEGVQLTTDECDALAYRDGFRWRVGPCAHCCNWANCNTLQACRQIGYPKDAGCFNRMMEFWRGRLPFRGQVIHWDYDARFMEKLKKPKGRADGGVA